MAAALRSRAFALALLVSLAASSRVRAEDPAAPATAAFAAELEAIRTRHGLPALAVLGLRGGRVERLAATGLRAVGHAEAVTPQDLFHIGSCAKAMTATLLATLVEDGLLRFDLPVLEALPELKDVVHPDYASVTLLDLLRHRGGIAERKSPALGVLLLTRFRGLGPDSRAARRAAVEIVLSRQPTVAPGSSTEYSNYGYMVAAAMAEAVTGQPYEELMRERLFEPLGMHSAGFLLPGSLDVVDQPRGHLILGGETFEPVAPDPDRDLPRCITPAGLIHLTLPDWAKFIQAHLEAGRGPEPLLEEATFRLLQTPPDGTDYACGFGVVERPWSRAPVLTHSGSNGFWYSVVWAAPAEGVAALAVTNAAPPAAPQAVDEAVVAVFRALGVLSEESGR